MSRKNKNGGRRNYAPRTYSRDFLKPTPIERAIQEANKPASERHHNHIGRTRVMEEKSTDQDDML